MTPKRPAALISAKVFEAAELWEELLAEEAADDAAVPVEEEAREVVPEEVAPAVPAEVVVAPGAVTDEDGEDEVTDTDVDVVTETVPLLVAPAVVLPVLAPALEEPEPELLAPMQLVSGPLATLNVPD